MRSHFFLKCSIPAIAIFLLLIICVALKAQDINQISADSVNIDVGKKHPNSVPYSSERSVASHILAMPSYMFHWATRPLGWAVQWGEVKVPRLFQGERGDFGVYPFFELTGETGFSYGLLIFHRNLLHEDHNIRIEALFSSINSNDFDFEYTINNFLSDNGRLLFDAEYNNRTNRTFLIGNDIDFDERSIFDREEYSVSLEYSHRFKNRTYLHFKPRFLNKNIIRSDDEQESDYPPFPESLIGTTSILSMNTRFAWDGARGLPRINSGTRVITDIIWNRSLNRDDFHYVTYNIELNHFIPLTFLHNTRRFAFKANLEKTESFQGSETPFFDLPDLGSSSTLRGFQSDRFRDTGSLLFTLEYRYPIWDFSDLVFFIDEGQVFNHFDELGFDRFNTSYGFGVHLISSSGFALRAELAFSKETSRGILLISPNF